MRTLLSLLLCCFLHLGLFAQENHPETIVFKIDGKKVKGYFFPSKIANAPTLFHLPGLADSGNKWGLGNQLSSAGINVFTIDFRGWYGSEGKHSLKNGLEDIMYGLAFLKSKDMMEKYAIDTSNIILSGYSYGGGLALAYSSTYSSPEKLIAIAPLDFEILAHQMEQDAYTASFISALFDINKKPDGPISFKYSNPADDILHNRKEFTLDASGLKNKQILLISGENDQTLDPDLYAHSVYQQLKDENVTIEIKRLNTGHSFAGVEEKLINHIKHWIKDKE